MRKLRISILVATFFVSLASAYGQVLATQRVGFGLPAGQVPAPNNPGGAVVVGKNFYSGDAANGFRHWAPADPNNANPVNEGILVFDPDPSFSMGGTLECIFFCQVGQIAFDGKRTVYLASYDHAKGNGLSFPGLWRLDVDPKTGRVSPMAQLAQSAGLTGNMTTAVALGPDGSLYVGFLKNGNVVRVTNASGAGTTPSVVQSVGSVAGARSILSMTFAGSDLYIASSTGLSVIKNAVASTCLGGCNAVTVNDGFSGTTHVGVTSKGTSTLYVGVNGHGVFRYKIATGKSTLISTGGIDGVTGAVDTFAFVAGHSNMVQIDRLGNLWIGDDPQDGAANFTGRIWYISAASLATVR
jgi:hypothetical protein